MKAGKANDGAGIDTLFPNWCTLHALELLRQSYSNMKQIFLNPRESPQGRPFQRLELYEVKVSRTVLRGGEVANGFPLPDCMLYAEKGLL